MAPASTGDDFGAEQLDAEDVEGLAANVLGAHVDSTFHSEFGADGHGDAVLAGAGFGNNFGFAKSADEEDLAQSVVDLVAAVWLRSSRLC